MAVRMAARDIRELQQKGSVPALKVIEKELTESKETVQELQKKMDNKKRKYKLESAKLEIELDDTQEKNGELHSEIERLRQNRMDSAQVDKELKKVQREVRKLQSQYETERQNRITAEDELDEAKRTIYSLECKCAELTPV
jgi:predicted RNase H-like nuclease (RuvC/YqgF family)